MSKRAYKSTKWHAQELKCAKCKRNGLRRETRRGFFQIKVFPKFGYYPWECLHCRKVSLLRRQNPVRVAEPVSTPDSQLSY